MYNEGMSSWGRENMPLERSASPAPVEPELNGKARIKVIGVGGAGNNAVNRMIDAGITSAEYVAVNTDAQILACNKAEHKIQIGAKLTKGLGAGADPEIGRAAAEEDKEVLVKAVENTDLLFITAGMGGGTGTGAAPVIAKIAKDLKILTVAVVTEPFSFEGKHRMDNTTKGLDNLRKYVDTLIIIPNEKIGDVVPKNAPMSEALRVADEVLKQGIRGIADLIVTPALINLDFADVKAILKDRGLAHMGVGVAKGENRIVEAVRLAVNCPLLETTIEGATGVILNVVGGNDLTFDEVRLAANLIHSVVDYSANIIFGACIDENIRDEVEVTVIATGFPSASGRDAGRANANRAGGAQTSKTYNYGQNQPQTAVPPRAQPTTIPPQPSAPYGGVARGTVPISSAQPNAAPSQPYSAGQAQAYGSPQRPAAPYSAQGSYGAATPAPAQPSYSQPAYPGTQPYGGSQRPASAPAQYGASRLASPQNGYSAQAGYSAQPAQPGYSQPAYPSQPAQNPQYGYTQQPAQTGYEQRPAQPAYSEPQQSGEFRREAAPARTGYAEDRQPTKTAPSADEDEDYETGTQRLPDFVRKLIGKKK